MGMKDLTQSLQTIKPECRGINFCIVRCYISKLTAGTEDIQEAPLPFLAHVDSR